MTDFSKEKRFIILASEGGNFNIFDDETGEVWLTLKKTKKGRLGIGWIQPGNFDDLKIDQVKRGIATE